MALGRDVSPVYWLLPNAVRPKGKWTHLACVHEGGRRASVRLYIDGRPNREQKYVSMATIAGYPMFLGAQFHTNGQGQMDLFNGSLASLRVYDYARTAEEIAHDAAAAASAASPCAAARLSWLAVQVESADASLC